MNKAKNRIPNKTKAKGFSLNSVKSFKNMQANNKLIYEYQMYLDRLYTQGIQHCIISDLAYQLAEVKGVSADQLMQEISAGVSLERLTTYMTDNSEYPLSECQDYIRYRAIMSQELDKVDTGEIKK